MYVQMSKKIARTKERMKKSPNEITTIVQNVAALETGILKLPTSLPLLLVPFAFIHYTDSNTESNVPLMPLQM